MMPGLPTPLCRKCIEVRACKVLRSLLTSATISLDSSGSIFYALWLGESFFSFLLFCLFFVEFIPGEDSLYFSETLVGRILKENLESVEDYSSCESLRI